MARYLIYTYRIPFYFWAVKGENVLVLLLCSVYSKKGTSAYSMSLFNLHLSAFLIMCELG